jgi:hypothetical protein
VLTVANFNMHCGIDGWGRPFDFLATCEMLNADVLVLEETWTPEQDLVGGGQAALIAATLGYQAFPCVLAEGRRIMPQPGATEAWMPRPASADRNRALYFDCARPLAPATLRMARYLEAEPGRWGIAVLVRSSLQVEGTRTLHLAPLARDRVRRAAVVVDLELDGTPISVIGTHMSHLHLGSHRHWAELRHLLRVQARPDAVWAGDMNLWGPPLRAFLPGWHQAVKGPSWPAAKPHSQIDHIIMRGALRSVSGEVLPAAGSDHRPIRARIQPA